jgi:hypothetical protein
MSRASRAPSWLLAAAAAAAGPRHARAGNWTFTKLGTDPSSPDQLSIHGVAAGAFDPSKMKNFVRDVRAPLLRANPGGDCPGNIYAANVVNNGAINVYFGGWDGVSACHDSISIAVSDDDWRTFNPHQQVVATGGEDHVNNPSVLKRPDDGSFAIMYTQLPNAPNALNKPGFSTSPNGVNWSPRAGGDAQLVQASKEGIVRRPLLPRRVVECSTCMLAPRVWAPSLPPSVTISCHDDGSLASSSRSAHKMTGFDGWGAADVNGCNVIVFANDDGLSKYHMCVHGNRTAPTFILPPCLHHRNDSICVIENTSKYNYKSGACIRHHHHALTHSRTHARTHACLHGGAQ